jgi:hypothetical protein
MKVIIVLIASILVGCASTAPTHTYRPRGSIDDAWAITGKYNEITGKIDIYINGTNVIDSNVSIWDGSGEVSAKYQDKSVTASCNNVSKLFASYEQCIVFVDNERAATLQF